MRYYIGVDGGGTKTALCAASVDDPTPRYTKTTGSSWREHGALEVSQIIREAVSDLMDGDFSEIAGIAMGLPCYGESAEGDRLLKLAVHEAFADIPIYFTNDVEVGWAGSLALAPGINVVAGTGSIAFGKDIRGNTARSGGWSEFFGDEGSCYWMGRKVMELFSKQSDGRRPKDELFLTVCKEFGLENEISFIDLIHTKYAGNRERVASLQFLAQKAALAGAPSAKALYGEAVYELCLLVSAVRDKLDFGADPWTVSYSGGLFKAGELILPRFSKEIEDLGGILSPPKFEPVQGAALLAFQQFYPGGLPCIQGIISKKRKES